MDVSIHRKFFSFGVQYSIETPTATYSAIKKIFSLLPHITIQDASDSVLATITGESIIRTKFTISLSDSRTYEYHCEKFWASVDVCEGEGGPFHLYAHKGLRYSIFQQEIQVAAFSTQQVAVAGGQTFDLRVNASANLPLVLAMILCSNTASGDDTDDDTLTLNLGQLTEGRKFDDTWRPTDEIDA